MRSAIYLIIFSIVILSGCLQSDTGSSGSPSIKIVNPIQNCKLVDVPYQVQVPYQEEESYLTSESTNVPLRYTVIETNNFSGLQDLNVVAIGIVKLRNDDSLAGGFGVTQEFITLNRPVEKKRNAYHILPGQTVEFREVFDKNIGEDFNWKYNVDYVETHIVTNTVTKYRMVTKYRTETQYRQEEKCS